jgi:5-formyltetrahydrofolate cyclo-ligase
MQEKRSLRDQINDTTATYDQQTRRAMHRSLWERVYAAPWWNSASVVLGYAAMGHEVDLFPLLKQAQQEGRRIALPRLETPAKGMRFFFISSLERDVQLHPFGFLQPRDSLPEYRPSQAALILVPGRAFDRTGNRLGHGGGYYDRFLAQCSVASIIVGIAYSFQIVPRVPREAHDAVMQWVVTDQETISTELTTGR